MSAAWVPPTLLRLAGAGAVVPHSVVSSRRTTIVQGCKAAAWTNKRKRDPLASQARLHCPLTPQAMKVSMQLLPKALQ